LLTLRAARALRSADVILFDHQISADILDFSRREAKKMLVGATDGEQSIALAVMFAKRGRRVVRLVAGDPMRSPTTAPELTAYRAAGVEIELIPGIADVGETARTDRDASSTIPSDHSHRLRKSDPSAAS
jgi:uroporphyrin-III C-methyltransferase/precorrin-2 dehydrogenase/sirohydrochlorin ferrochelatase